MVLKSGSETEGFRYTELGKVNGPSGLSSACVGDTASDGGLWIAGRVDKLVDIVTFETRK